MGVVTVHPLIDGVRSAQAAGGRAELLAAMAEPVVRELLRRDEDLSDLEVTGAGLEDAFLALTRSRSNEPQPVTA